MSLDLEHLIARTMADEVADLAGVRFTGDEIVHKGRAARARRRLRGGVTLATVVVAVATLVVTLTTVTTGQRLSPVGSPSGQGRSDGGASRWRS